MLDLSLINPRKITELEILDMIRKDPCLICDRIPQTEQRCITAVQENGMLLEFISKGSQTDKICVAAISNNINAFAFVAKKRQTKEKGE